MPGLSDCPTERNKNQSLQGNQITLKPVLHSSPEAEIGAAREKE